MTRNALLGPLALAALFCATAISPARAGSNYLFQVDVTTGDIVTIDGNNVSNPVAAYHITGLVSGDQVAASSFDSHTDRLYFVVNHTQSSQAELEYAQINAQGHVVSQAQVDPRLPTQDVTVSHGAGYDAGRVWISQNLTNRVYGFDPNNLSATPVVLTLPTPSGHSSTQFNLGALTFDDSHKDLFVSGTLGPKVSDGSPAFLYEYQLNGTGIPSLINSLNYAISATTPYYNGMDFDQATGRLYAYGSGSGTGDLYTINTTTLHISGVVGTNANLRQGGDLAGLNPAASVPEPSSVVGLATGTLAAATWWLIRKGRRHS